MKYYLKVFFSFILILIINSCEYSNIPYRKERLIKIHNSGYITKYYFPLGRTDSVRIYFEDLTGKYNYETPIAEYSMRYTNYDFLLAYITADTVNIYFSNTNLIIKTHINKVDKFFIKFKRINKIKAFVKLQDSLKISRHDIQVLHYLKDEGVWSDTLINPFIKSK